MATEYALDWMARAKVTDRQEEQQNYILKKRKQMQTAIDAATGEASQHAKILAWGLSQDMPPPKKGAAVKTARKRSLQSS